ncbi:MAG: hypothetical protein ACR2QH_07325 [Geminicoccaceae bacterium]
MSSDDQSPGATAADPEQEVNQHHDDLESYAGGYIQAHHGSIQPWLLVVYAVLFVWALYYLYVYWGGLGPGLEI